MKRGKKSNYTSDRPINKFSEDLLGRGDFVRRLAGDIYAWKGSDSLVIGLYGDWGSGKTSIKNLLINTLKKERTKIPILEFNPWQLSGSGGISETFFEELRVILRPKAGDPKQVAKRAMQLDAYAKRFSLTGKIARVFAPFFAGMGMPDMAVAAGMAAEGLNQAAEVTQAGSEAQKAAAETDELTLSELKKSLEDSLRDLKNPLLVVIDDIDRLSTREILHVVQLVKVNADFPNLTYLLLFERSIVAKALDQISDNRGQEFLEKIIQVGYHVPTVSRSSVQKVLFNGLDRHLAHKGVCRRWNKERWSELYSDGLAPFFRNLRHVYRFLSSFDFHVRQFLSADQFEVNPVDLIALEALRVFEPGVFERLSNEKRILTRDIGEGLFAKIDQDVVDSVVIEISSRASKRHEKQVRTLLHQLFPATWRSYNDRESSGRDLHLWVRDARVCHPDLFDRYFALGVQEGELAQSELDQLIDFAGDSSRLVTQLRALENRGLLKKAFERLDAHKEEIPLEKMPGLVRALADVGDGFQEKEAGMFEIDMRMMAARLIYFGLRQEKNEQRRFEIMFSAFSESNGILIPVFETALQKPRKEGEQQNRDYLINETHWDELKELSVKKLRLAASDGRLVVHPQAGLLLWRWSDWEIDETRAWVKTQIAHHEGALWLLAILLGEVHAHGHELKIHYYMKLADVERFADLESIKKALATPEVHSMTTRQTIALHAFERAVKRREQGKPDLDGLDQNSDDE